MLRKILIGVFALVVLIFCGIVALIFWGRNNIVVEALPAEDRKFIEAANQLEVLQLEPTKNVFSAKGFDGCHIVKTIAVTDPALRRQIISDLEHSLLPASSRMNCYEPHHGLRFKSGNTTGEYVICFKCCTVNGYVGGGQTLSLGVNPLWLKSDLDKVLGL
ncbi:MAG: hypothetical protein C5B53_10530 [Candidatus Melainabacteria bacterium]|nr:MAG: hypothetical protein C5B53_10530 [Candidatus Melainabacteria bacterium]